MSKKKTQKKTIKSKTTIAEIHNSRTGGQIALSGFSYQMLYSCYLILTKIDTLTQFHFEGIEDIDAIHFKNEVQNTVHIQLKYSSVRQDASFLKPVLKNMLEVYLIDKNRKFKLVYDFPVAKGNMSKLFADTLDASSQLYWESIIREIQKDNNNWDWKNFEFLNFINAISFENSKRNTLERTIENSLIEKYGIITDNIALFVNGIKTCCWNKMSNRELINKSQLDNLIQNIKDDIMKGIQNPAHNWIKRIRFDYDSIEDLSYFEGKKATPQDIANHLPVKRSKLEKTIKLSISDNKVTVLKASSGQGKTTLALQTAFAFTNEYCIYQLSWCNDARELNNIVVYFESRIKLGEKILILIDNLDSQLSEWNRLAQIMQERVLHHYKLLITTREDDWYNYAGNITNVKALNIIKILLEEQDAQEIYLKLRENNKVHNSISDWKKAWFDVQDQQLLIEYVYLLTHGKMLADRISEQITQINKTDTGRAKCEILRLISFADICGIRLSIKKLISQLNECSHYDFGEVLKSMENEFMIRIDDIEKYIEGLHPIRSQHIVDRLHEFTNINDTAINVAKISDKNYLAKLFSNFPRLIENKKVFYTEVVKSLWINGIDIFVPILQGAFSGSVMEYYRQNKSHFDDANDHGGIFLIAMESCPFVTFKEFDYKLEILSSLNTTIPNANLTYLNNIKDKMPSIVLSETDSYMLSKAIFEQMSRANMDMFCSAPKSFVVIADWLLNIDGTFNLAKIISLDNLWQDADKYNLEIISKIMYLCFCGNKKVFLSFLDNNLSMILTYLKEWTNSLELNVSNDKQIIHVKYILLPSEIKKGSEESVNRIKSICRTLPIFNTYCADGIKPKIEILSNYNIPDDAHKAMPIRNIFIMFHQEFTALWKDTIMSNYEFDSIKEWLEFWFTVREDIIQLSQKCNGFLFKLLETKKASDIAEEIDELRTRLNKKLSKSNGFPRENRPFMQEKISPPDSFSIAQKYFNGISNFFYQFAGIIKRDEQESHLPIVNLRDAISSLVTMQNCFSNIIKEHNILQKEHELLCTEEEKTLNITQIACIYYLNHLPNKFFNKYIVKKWYDDYFWGNMEKAKSSLIGLEYKYSPIYPQTVIYEGTLSYYPIVVSNLDLMDGENLISFIYKCTPFIEINFDYLIIAIQDKNGKILENGLKITKKCLFDLKCALDNEDSEKSEKWIPPFPENITDKILTCFNIRLHVKQSESNGYEGLDIIAELLWSYSKIRETLTDKNDLNYCNKLLTNYKAKIYTKFTSYKPYISEKLYDEIYNLCENVIQGTDFSDYEYNNFILHFIYLVVDNLNKK